MKAVQIIAPGKIELQDLPLRPLLPHEIRIGVVATAICGSDLKNISSPKCIPQVPGHECAGIVLEAPMEPVTAISTKPGDHVTIFPMMGCMRCEVCRVGRFRECTQRADLGFQIPGAFAEEVIVDARFVIPLLPGISIEQGALVEHLSCGYRLANEISEHFQSREVHILIIGDGPIALAEIQCLRNLGYHLITLIGKHPNRIETARILGAEYVIECSSLGLEKDLAALTPVDVCIYAASTERTLEQVVPFIRTGGIIYPQVRILYAALLERIRAANIGIGWAFAYEFRDFIEVMQLMKIGSLRTNFLLKEKIDLSEVALNFARLYEKGQYVKLLIRNDLSPWKHTT